MSAINIGKVRVYGKDRYVVLNEIIPKNGPKHILGGIIKNRIHPNKYNLISNLGVPIIKKLGKSLGLVIKEKPAVLREYYVRFTVPNKNYDYRLEAVVKAPSIEVVIPALMIFADKTSQLTHRQFEDRYMVTIDHKIVIKEAFHPTRGNIPLKWLGKLGDLGVLTYPFRYARNIPLIGKVFKELDFTKKSWNEEIKILVKKTTRGEIKGFVLNDKDNKEVNIEKEKFPMNAVINTLDINEETNVYYYIKYEIEHLLKEFEELKYNKVTNSNIKTINRKQEDLYGIQKRLNTIDKKYYKQLDEAIEDAKDSNNLEKLQDVLKEDEISAIWYDLRDISKMQKSYFDLRKKLTKVK